MVDRFAPPSRDDVAPLLADLEVEPGRVRCVDPRAGRDAPREAAGDVLLAADALEAPGWEDALESAWAPDGFLLVCVPGAPSDATLAALRNRLWPRAHVTGLYRCGAAGTRGTSLSNGRALEPCAFRGVVLVCRRYAHVLDPDATTAKFDQNASGWNGNPGSPGYRHFRWMRRLVGRFATPAPGARILDFGCGAGWVGIEAALLAPGCALRAFDPSPQMVSQAQSNARASGIADFEGRVGFGESPPYPGADEPPFDLVVSSGVLSYARDHERWMEGLARAVRPGGTLVVGDLNPASRGMRARRRARPLLPVREMNAHTRDDARRWLEARGFALEDAAGYQLTTPVPQAMHFSDERLGGALSLPLLVANRACSALDRALGGRLSTPFDSWVMRLRAPSPA